MIPKRLLMAVAALLGTFAIFALAQAAPEAGEVPAHMLDRHLAHLTRHLDLTDAQQQQIKSMFSAELPRIQPLMQQLAAERQQMVNATAHGQFDQAKVAAIANQQAQTTAALIIFRQEMHSKIYNLLTPEQRLKFDEMQQRHLQHMQKWMGGPSPKE